MVAAFALLIAIDDLRAELGCYGSEHIISLNIDAQVGRVLDELEQQVLADETIVVLWADHGYHLGEKGLWGKTTNFELDARVPLIVRAPGKAGNGKTSPALVELVDMYPTLAEMAGLPVGESLEGTSFAPLLEDPASGLPAVTRSC